MSDWRVLVVEDDSVVSYVYRTVIERTPGFEVVACVESGSDALLEIRRCQPHLLLLDLTLRGTHGLELLRKLRGSGSTVEVIAVTASNRVEIVQAMLQLGVVDYLVKPFPPERLQQALGLFRRRMSALAWGSLTQQQVDELAGAGRMPRRWLPKGLSDDTMVTVRGALAEADDGVSAARIAELTGVSRVTARRYLEYLAATAQATLVLHSSGSGRPEKRYCLVEPLMPDPHS
jgi:response regulator of citrate/malate metabolism